VVNVISLQDLIADSTPNHEPVTAPGDPISG
jgi:hypothetical protein